MKPGAYNRHRQPLLEFKGLVRTQKEWAILMEVSSATITNRKARHGKDKQKIFKEIYHLSAREIEEREERIKRLLPDDINTNRYGNKTAWRWNKQQVEYLYDLLMKGEIALPPIKREE